MRNTILLLAALFGFSSCATIKIVTTTYVYEGLVKYYLPNGEIDIYDANYTETYVNGIKNNEYLNVDVGDGNVYIHHDIPYTFKGHLTTVDNNANERGHEIDNDGNYILSIDGENHMIPADVYNRLKYLSNGDPDKLKKSLIEYLQKE